MKDFKGNVYELANMRRILNSFIQKLKAGVQPLTATRETLEEHEPS